VKLEGWIITDFDGSVLVLLGSKEYHMNNVLHHALEAQPTDKTVKKPITIDIPDVAGKEEDREETS